jgi:hypothetical protein
MTASFTPKQLYKNRAEAYRLFILPQGLPVGQTTFYNHAERLGMVRTDKSLELAALMAYVKEELKIDPATGQSLVEREQEKRSSDLDLREKELKVGKLEREKEREDGKTLTKDESRAQIVAILGMLRTALKRWYRTGTHEIIKKCAGDHSRENEVYEYLDLLLRHAFNDVAGAGKIEGMLVKSKGEE